MIEKRKERASFWFHSSLNLTRDLASTLLSGKRVFVCFQGAKLYYGKALLCGFEWWTGNHPDLLAELKDLQAISNPS